MTNKNKQDIVDESAQRVAIFIDGSNLYHSLEENCKRFDLDFRAFSNKLCNGRRLFRTYYYNVLRDPDRNPQAYQDQKKFLAALYSTPYLEVRLGAAKQRGDVVIEKGVDIMLATDLLHMAWNDLYDVAIVVSGDGDFAYALQTVKNMGKHIEVGAFPANLAWELSQIADRCEFFTPEYFSDIWSKRRNGSRNSDNASSDPSRRGWRRPANPRLAPYPESPHDDPEAAEEA